MKVIKSALADPQISDTTIISGLDTASANSQRLILQMAVGNDSPFTYRVVADNFQLYVAPKVMNQ